MTWWMLVVGGLLIVVALFDAVTTTISVTSRSGPLTTLANRLVSSVAHRPPVLGRRRAMRAAGSTSVVLTVLAWVLVLWAGWGLLFSADADAVVRASTDEPADASGRWLFAAYTLYTLGYGNYVPTGAWEIVASVALVMGFALFTLSVTYAIPVVSAVVDRRRQGAVISTAGTTPSGIVATLHQRDGGTSHLEGLLQELTPSLLTTAERHLAYPVLDNYFDRDRASALAPSVAALDDATTMLCHGADAEHKPSSPTVRQWRAAVDHLLDRVTVSAAERDTSAPAMPDVGVLDELGIPRVDEPAYRRAMAADEPRRRLLHRYVRSTGWDWPTG